MEFILFFSDLITVGIFKIGSILYNILFLGENDEEQSMQDVKDVMDALDDLDDDELDGVGIFHDVFI